MPVQGVNKKRLLWYAAQMKKTKIIVFVMVFLLSPLASGVEILRANEWAVPKQAATILAMPAIHKSMQIIQNSPSNTLRIRYPGGDEGTLWANELRSWLIALGLSSKRIDLVPGSASASTIELEVLSHKLKAKNKPLTQTKQAK